MRRWLCCSHFDTPYLENENGLTSSPDRTSGTPVVYDIFLIALLTLSTYR
jgi:hypothetical protein